MSAGNALASRRSEPLAIPGLDVAKAKRYSKIQLAMLAASTAWSIARLVWFADDRRAARLKQAIARRVPDRRLAGPVFLASASLLSWAASLPLAYVGGHLIERRFGLTKQSSRGWLGDRVKALVLSLAIQTPLLAAAFAVIRRRPRDWWLVLSGASVPLAVLFSNLAPTLIMPRFNRFVPLDDPALETRIRALAERSGVAISDVYAMDMSRQSEKPNAFFAGLGNTKRIVLGDTLLARFAPDEIEGVVAHEIGHQVQGDIWRFIGFGSAAGFSLAWALARLTPPLLRRTRGRTGVDEVGDEAALPALALVMIVLGVALAPLQAAFSRAIERRTDGYALALTGDGEAYARAMERLAAQSLTDPDPSPPVVFMLYSHPPIAERIRRARGLAERAGKTRDDDITA
jgi:STE24 endopeptidase